MSEQRVALVTGASSGIGAATARRLASDGYTVVLVARRRERLEGVAADIQADGHGQAVVVPADLQEPSSVGDIIDLVRERFGRLDVLVNNAGYGAWGGILDASLEELRREVEVNLVATVALTHAAAPLLLDGGGDIVNVSSLAARFPAPGAVGYGSAKAGVSHFTHSISAELRPRGVRVLLVETGEVATEMQSEEDIAAMTMLQAEDVADAIAYAVSRPRHVSLRTVQMLAAEPADG